MEQSWSSFLFQQANEALHHQHQVSGNSLVPLLGSGAEQPDQKPVLPIPMDQKPPISAAELLKDNVATGAGGVGSSRPPVAVIKKEPKSKTPFICGYCNKAFRDSYHLRRHESCHTGIKMVPRLKKTLASPTMVPLISTVHQENSENSSFVTTVAGILTPATTSTSTSTSIMSPMPQQQPSLPKKPPKPVKKNHGCDMCGKAFRDVYHLNRHKLSHSDEKPFECPVCRQRFKRKDRMTYHARSHDGGVHKPYICSVCGKSFSRPDHLSCHVKHVHSSERPFKCQITACTSAFATKDRLRSHMIRHEGKVTCNICGKMLSAAYISSHLKTHGQAAVNTACSNKDANNVHSNSAATTPHTNSPATISTVNRSGTAGHPVTIAAQLNVATSSVNMSSVSLAPVNIPTIGHPVTISAPMAMNISPLNIAMRPIESMSFLSQVLPSSPPW